MGMIRKPGWEIRSEDDSDSQGGDGLAEIRSAIDGFTASADQRLGGIEGTINELRSRLDTVERVQRRPGSTETRQQGNEVEARAFAGFLRRGREALAADEVRSLRVSDDTAGGYLAPDQFVAELLRNVVQFSPVRSVARVANTSAGAVILPKRTAGLTAAWVGETQARPETTATFGQLRYEVRELAAYVDVSSAMLEDSAFDVASVLSLEFAEEFGKAEATAFVNGDGVLKPMGFMADAGLSSSNSGDAAKVTADGLIGIYHDLPAAYRANAVWMMNSGTLAAVRKLKTTGGDYLLSMTGLNGAPATTLLGRPVIEAPDMPDVAGDAFPIAFGDFSQGFRIYDRIALSVLRDPYSQATNGMTRFHARRRVAAGVAKAEAIRKLKIAA